MTLPDSVFLQQDELFTLKSWLLQQAETMKRGKAIWLEESEDGIVYKLIAAVGKTDEGASVLWHEPLPSALQLHEYKSPDGRRSVIHRI